MQVQKGEVDSLSDELFMHVIVVVIKCLRGGVFRVVLFKFPVNQPETKDIHLMYKSYSTF